MRSQESIRYYDTHAAAITLLEGEDRSYLQPFLNELRNGARVLDLGCGTGGDLKIFKSQGYRASGLDASKGMILEAQKRGLEVEERNILFWSPREGTLDGVWINRTFQHFKPKEAQRVVASAFRALAHDGVLGVIVPEGTGSFEDRTHDLDGPSRLIHLYTEKQLSSMIEQTGFRIIRIGRREADGISELLVIGKRV
ncbi:MAG: class I SAM-dependent methyltransferase [Bdellovibrionales bacterium]|nr:class I SAM-dependent methyltransferase [Bdellovibrionales bacterium]